jgi:hypothetical protein
MKKINLPFTNNLKGGNNSFKILDESKLNNTIKNKPKGLFNMVKKIFFKNNSNNVKVSYVKASNTQKYYKNIKIY